MCQAYEGEAYYLRQRDIELRRKGYEAQKAGVPRSACREANHVDPRYNEADRWCAGWDAAQAGESL